MSNTVPVSNTPGTTSADPSKLTPEAITEQLRSMRSQIDQVQPLSDKERRQLKQRLRSQTRPVVEASINVMGVLTNVSQAIGQPIEEVRQVQTETFAWDAAAEEARAFAKAIEGVNLIRRQRLALIGTQAYTIGTSLAKDPANGVLLAHVEEVKKLKSMSRHKKAPQAPQPPASPAPAPTPASPAPAHDASNHTEGVK